MTRTVTAVPAHDPLRTRVAMVGAPAAAPTSCSSSSSSKAEVRLRLFLQYCSNTLHRLRSTSSRPGDHTACQPVKWVGHLPEEDILNTIVCGTVTSDNQMGLKRPTACTLEWIQIRDKLGSMHQPPNLSILPSTTRHTGLLSTRSTIDLPKDHIWTQ